MTDLQWLLQRHSIPAKQLLEPAPNPAELELILQAACSVPDHGALQPYRFLVIDGDQRVQLGETFAQSVQQRQPDSEPAVIEKQRSKPMRAPMIITVIASPQNHPKIPEIEQLLCAGAAAEHILLAANSLGFGSVWLTGDNAYDWNVCEALGLQMHEKIIGFIYLGTAMGETTAPERPKPRLERWNGPQQMESDI